MFRSFFGLMAAWSIIGMLNVFNREKQTRLRSALHSECMTRGYLERIIAGITDSLVVTDIEGIIVMMNDVLLAMIGRERSGLRGEHIKSIMENDNWERINY